MDAATAAAGSACWLADALHKTALAGGALQDAVQHALVVVCGRGSSSKLTPASCKARKLYKPCCGLLPTSLATAYANARPTALHRQAHGSAWAQSAVSFCQPVSMMSLDAKLRTVLPCAPRVQAVTDQAQHNLNHLWLWQRQVEALAQALHRRYPALEAGAAATCRASVNATRHRSCCAAASNGSCV